MLMPVMSGYSIAVMDLLGLPKPRHQERRVGIYDREIRNSSRMSIRFEADLNYQVEYSVEEPWCLPKSERPSEIIK